MKAIFPLLTIIIASTLLQAETQILYQDDFESYDLGPFLGQGDTEVMRSTVSCEGEDPAPGEVDITNDGENWILHLGKVKEPAGVQAPKKDRGVRIPLNWGDASYKQGDNARITISGKTRIPEGSGYAEIRLVTSEDQPILRFTPHSSDYKTYFYNHNHANEVDPRAANTNNEYFVNAVYNRTWYHTTNAVIRNTWCEFEVVFDCDSASVESYSIRALDDSGFEFTGRRVAHLRYTLERPEYVEFTAVGNGYDLNRPGADFDDLTIVYEYEPPEDDFWTLFEDDFQDYELNTSLSDYGIYGRIGEWDQYTDTIETNEFGKYARIFMGKPGAGEFPKDGVTLPFPDDTVFEPGEKLRLTATYYVPDNGCWTMFRSGDIPVATYGFHTANKWFATWSGEDMKELYDGYERSPYKHFITTSITLAYDAAGPYLERVEIKSDEDLVTKWTTDWCEYYDTHLKEIPDNFAIQVQGWNNFDGRYILLNYLKLEQTAAVPEPAFLLVLAALALAFARRQR